MCGGTNWYEVLCWHKSWMNLLDILLSITYVHGAAPAWEKISCSFDNTFVIEVDVLYRMGSSKTQFAS